MIGTFKSIINLLDRIGKAYDATKKWFKEWCRRKGARKVRKAIDSGDTDTVDSIVHRIKSKRRYRHDGS